MLGRRGSRPREPLVLVLGVLLIVLVVLAVQAALGLVFNPRYRDFPFTALTAATIPFLLLMGSWPRRKDLRPSAETVAAATLVLCAVYIALSETFANWQALWFCGGLSRWRSVCCRRGPRQTEDEQRAGQRGKVGVVQHEAKTCGRKRDRHQDDRGPHAD